MSVEGAVPLYDALSDDYDRFVNWENRLAYEMPFIEWALREADARRVLDIACGTGMHAIELARRGYEVVGTDLSAPMVERARENAATLRQALRQAQDEAQDPAAGVGACFVVAGFGELAEKLALSKACPEPSRRACPERSRRVEGVGGQFDAVLCLGNSLPHVLGAGDLGDAMADFAAVLRPGGLLLIKIICKKQSNRSPGILPSERLLPKIISGLTLLLFDAIIWARVCQVLCGNRLL